MARINLDEIQNILGYKFNNPELLLEALTHPSYALSRNYQRLEFLGDSILGFIVAEILYHDKVKTEGELTDKRKAIVSREPLAQTVKALGLDKYVIKGGGATLSQKNYSDIFESVLAAIYLDGGIEEAGGFAARTLLASGFSAARDAKSELQEYCAAKGLKPIYNLISKTGADNNPMHTVELTIDGAAVTKGVGKKRQDAEKDAAERYLKTVKG